MSIYYWFTISDSVYSCMFLVMVLTHRNQSLLNQTQTETASSEQIFTNYIINHWKKEERKENQF